jgi:hypothetical protein
MRELTIAPLLSITIPSYLTVVVTPDVSWLSQFCKILKIFWNREKRGGGEEENIQYNVLVIRDVIKATLCMRGMWKGI